MVYIYTTKVKAFHCFLKKKFNMVLMIKIARKMIQGFQLLPYLRCSFIYIITKIDINKIFFKN